MRRRSGQGGQATVEYAITFAAIMAPLMFAIIFTAELLWVWHSVVDFTRDGASYAATHCWQGNGGNVQAYMQSHVPLMVDIDQFRNGQATIVVNYFSVDPTSGQLTDFACSGGECSTDCIPDAVTVTISNYQFSHFMSYMKLPPVQLPDFRTSLAIQSAGCDPEQGTCLP
jgi:hypothetical protein